MKAKFVNEALNEASYIDDLYLQKDQLLDDLEVAEERGENIMPIVQELRKVEQAIEYEEIEQQEMEEYKAQLRGENPYADEMEKAYAASYFPKDPKLS